MFEKDARNSEGRQGATRGAKAELSAVQPRELPTGRAAWELPAPDSRDLRDPREREVHR